MKQLCVYILASKKNGTLYAGVTSDLTKRISQHREGCGSGFTSRYRVHRLVWYELHGTMASAIEREKEIKNKHRTEKLILIVRTNPDWTDLYDTIIDID